MLLTDKKVAIIGAGPVGLTMARLLQQKGIYVTVYERDKNAQTRITGGTLDLHKGSGQDAMEAAGLLTTYYQMALPMGRTVADEHGNVLLTRQPTPETQYDNPEINRNDLRTLLLNSLADGTVVWDKKFTGLEAQNEKWMVQFEDGIPATADFVIGANGGMSKARTYVTDAEIAYTGTLIIQGEVLNPTIDCADFYQLCSNNILMAANKGNLLVANPNNGNLLSYNVIFEKPKNWDENMSLNFQDTSSISNYLIERLCDWAESYKQLLRSTASFVLWPTRKIPLDRLWKTNRPLAITLIGDAAHIMPPFAGQGVNTGLKDALILSNNLTNGKFDSITAAISDYEQQMFVYAAAAQRETSENELAMRQVDFSFQRFYQ